MPSIPEHWRPSRTSRGWTSCGESTRAEAQFVDLIKAYESQWGEDHPRTLLSKSNLGLVYSAQGNYGPAEPLLREVLEKGLAMKGPDHPHTVNSKVILGSVYGSQRKFDQAVPLLEGAVASSKSTLGEVHPFTLHAMKYLALTYHWAGKTALALPLYEHVLATYRQTPPPNDSDTLDTMDHLARAYLDAKMPQKAIALSQEVLTKFGLDDPRTLEARGILARALLQTGQAEKALPLVRDYVEGQRKQLGAESPQFAAGVSGICRALLDNEQYPEAELHLRGLLAIREKTTPDTWATFHTKSMLGAALLGQKKYADAEPLLRAAYEGMKRREPRMPPYAKRQLTEALERLVQLYDAWGKPDEAAKRRQELEAAKAVVEGSARSQVANGWKFVILRWGLNETFPLPGDFGLLVQDRQGGHSALDSPQGGGRWLGVVSNSRKTSDGSSTKNARAIPVSWFATRC